MPESASWIFKAKQPDDTTRDPISGEFFATEAIRHSAEALMREGIQNSLDAGRPGQQVRVRIRLSGDVEAAAVTSVVPFLSGIADHLRAPKNGLRDDQRPDLGRPCRYLVFEDFGTEGLRGDPLQWHHREGISNGFFAFFRAEGESDKSTTGQRGRWGVGKFVFPRASTGSTFFGLTIQADTGRELLMGRTILKSHLVDGSYYVPDGYYGLAHQLPVGRIVLPADDPTLLARFRAAFQLVRAGEPGLSLVVPWYDPEITRERLIEAAVRDWFFSIMTGELEVTIADPGGTVTLTAATLPILTATLPDDIRMDVEPLLALTRFALTDAGKGPVVLPAADTGGAPKWHDEMLPQEAAAKLRATLDAEVPIAVRIPLSIRRKGQGALNSNLTIYLCRDASADDGRPVFVREGIIVSDAKGDRARAFRSLVVCDDQPLAELLGDAENPSHTEWRPDTANFKDKYIHGPGYLKFVKQAVRELVSRIQETEDDTAPDLLVDLFSIPRDPEPDRPKRPETPVKEGDQPEPGPGPLPSKPARYRINRIRGGFTLANGSPGAKTPSELVVEAAYDVRRGSPFKKYDPVDFQMLTKPVILNEEPRGLSKISAAGNELRLKVTDPVFQLSIIGFDTNRDLVVRVTAKDDDT
jgi:hypothetical protein